MLLRNLLAIIFFAALVSGETKLQRNREKRAAVAADDQTETATEAATNSTSSTGSTGTSVTTPAGNVETTAANEETTAGNDANETTEKPEEVTTAQPSQNTTEENNVESTTDANEGEGGDGDDDGEKEDEGGEIVFFNPKETRNVSVLNGEDGTFGNWSSKGIGILDLADGRKVFSPILDEENPMLNYTIETNITVQLADHYELELSAKIVGYDASKQIRNASDPTGVNPYLGIMLNKNGTVKKIFDIDDYGRAFQDNDKWNNIKYIFNKKWEGNFTLQIIASKGTIKTEEEASNVYLDDITTRWIPRFVQPEEKVETGTNSTGGGTNSTTTGGGDDDEDGEDEVATGGMTTGFLVVVIVILLLVVLVLGFKHWQLRQSVEGAYNVNRTPVNSNYDNPMYSGQHTPGDRYGSVHD